MTYEEKENSRQLLQYILERNCVLESHELLYAVDLRLHPQLDHIEFHDVNNEYKMWDKEGCFFNFIALNYKETREEYYKKRSLTKNNY